MWEYAPIIVAIIAALGTAGNAVWTMWKDNKSGIASEAVAAAVSKATGAGMDMLSVRVASLELRHVDLRVEVAEKYVTKAALETTEARLLQAIAGVQSAVENMTARLDRRFDRPVN